MLQFGKYNTLVASRKTEHGIYLTELQQGQGELQEVLLPGKFVTPDMKQGDELNLFVYKDSEDRPVATTQTPKATVGQAAYLEVKQVTNIGAFLDWGLDKDLFLPFREQAEEVVLGEKYLVYVYFDFASKRVAASSNMNKYIKNREVDLKPNAEVDVMICYTNEIGIRVIIDQKYWGILFKNEVFGKIELGQHMKAYVKKVREDGKVDVSLQKQGVAGVTDVKEILLQKLVENNGVLTLNDDSPPETIHELLGISKKSFKKAVGMLYKDGKILLTEEQIKLKKK